MPDLPPAARPVTAFEDRVYQATRLIPRGKVSTYKLLAEAIGCRSSRAVGQALKRNPFAPAVPCHRVVRSDRSLGGFAGRTEGVSIRKKRNLLKSEGVGFEPDGTVRAGCVFGFGN